MKQRAYLDVMRRATAPWTTPAFDGRRRRQTLEGRVGVAGLRLDAKKKTMRTIAKLAQVGTQGGRSPLSDVIGHVRRALAAAASDRRPARPLQDIDDWSDQVEVAYHENCRASRCL